MTPTNAALSGTPRPRHAKTGAWIDMDPDEELGHRLDRALHRLGQKKNHLTGLDHLQRVAERVASGWQPGRGA